MQVFDHPRGLVITLDRQEQFLLSAPGRPPMRVSTVTTFADGDERGPYWTAAGYDVPLGDKEWDVHELDLRIRDAGLLPPHVRAAAAGLRELDFPADTACAAVPVVQQMQRGEVPLSAVTDLPRHSPTQVRVFPHRRGS